MGLKFHFCVKALFPKFSDGNIKITSSALRENPQIKNIEFILQLGGKLLSTFKIYSLFHKQSQ